MIPDDDQLDLLPSRCCIRRMQYSAAVTVLGPVAESVLRATVPPSAREQVDATEWRVWEHHLTRLIPALELAGVQVDDQQVSGAT